VRKRLSLLLFLSILSTQLFSAIEARLYINTGLYTAIDGSQFEFAAFNPTPVFSPINVQLNIVFGDTLILTLLNTDSVQRGFHIEDLNVSIVVSAGDSSVLSISAPPTKASYIYYDHLDFPRNTALGLAGVLAVGFENLSTFYWNLKEFQKDWAPRHASGQNVDWSTYYPDYFTINGKSSPDINSDTNARVLGAVGQDLYIVIVNSGQSTHSLHFHGFHAEIVYSSSAPHHVARIKDTFPVKPMESMVLKITPDKIGEYPVHDHNLVPVTAGGGISKRNVYYNAHSMMNSTRALLLGFLVSCCSSLVAQTEISLIGRNTGKKVLFDGNEIRVMGFARKLNENPGVPGPTLEVVEGDSVEIDFWNVSQGAPHTIHLHGLDVNQENDGVPHLSFSVEHMQHGYYKFKTPHPGTYLYHCHVVSTIHVQAGMFGMLIVRPKTENKTWEGGYKIDREYSFLMSEIDTNWHADSVLLHDHDSNMPMMQIPVPVYEPQHFLINGRAEQQLLQAVEVQAQANENIYLRLANLGYMSNRIVFPAELNARVIDSDGRPLPTEEAVDTLEIYPGERYGVLCNSSIEFQAQMLVQYFNLNTHLMEDQQEIEVLVEGFNGLKSILDKQEIKIFPNPFGECFSLEGENIKNSQLKLLDLQGNQVHQSMEMSDAGEICLPGLKPGIYLLNILDHESHQSSVIFKY